jgi:hypothetical protein
VFAPEPTLIRARIAALKQLNRDTRVLALDNTR